MEFLSCDALPSLTLPGVFPLLLGERERKVRGRRSKASLQEAIFIRATGSCQHLGYL